MRAIAAGLTDIGRERNHNEDRFILLPEFNVFVVADGMGGHQSGEVASRMAAATIATYFRTVLNGPKAGNHHPPAAGAKNGDGAGDVADTLKAAVCDANAKIFARADDSRAHRGMGTTVVAAAYRPSDASMHVVHAGDSRAYHIRGDSMKQLTRDHSLLSDALLERPELTEADLAYLPRNVITRALGIAPTVDVDAASCPAEPGDVFLLCSDGLHGLVDDSTIRAIVREHQILTEACSRLIEAANRNGGKDNITAVLIRIEDEEEPWSVRSPGAAPRASQAPEAPASSVDPSAPTDPSPELLQALAGTPAPAPAAPTDAAADAKPPAEADPDASAPTEPAPTESSTAAASPSREGAEADPPAQATPVVAEVRAPAQKKKKPKR
ncbi:MAG: protein phosphatase 2C domain-containing protein [Polyangiaceae bacterium]